MGRSPVLPAVGTAGASRGGSPVLPTVSGASGSSGACREHSSLGLTVCMERELVWGGGCPGSGRPGGRWGSLSLPSPPALLLRRVPLLRFLLSRLGSVPLCLCPSLSPLTFLCPLLFLGLSPARCSPPSSSFSSAGCVHEGPTGRPVGRGPCGHVVLMLSSGAVA